MTKATWFWIEKYSFKYSSRFVELSNKLGEGIK